MSVATIRLGDVCEILSGFAWSAAKFNQDRRGVPIIRIQNVDALSDNDFVYWDESYDERFVVRQGDILLTLSGSFRIESWNGPEGLLNQRIVKITPSSKLHGGWLLHVLRPRLGQIERLGRHALVNNVSLEDIRNLAIRLPPRPEQRRIAEVLEREQALRTKRRAALAQLDSLTQSIFLDLFGDPATNSKGLSLDPLGEHLLFVTSGGRGWAKFYAPTGSRFIRSLDVQMNGIGSDDIVFVRAPDNAEARRTQVKTGDVLLTITGSRIGRVAPCLKN
jgi:type I restriction enzyme S subunit